MTSRWMVFVFVLLLGCGEGGAGMPADGGTLGDAGLGGIGGEGGAGGGVDQPPVEPCDAGVCPCTEGGIRGAVEEGGGPFTFDCWATESSEWTSIVVTQDTITIDKDLIIDGEGNLTVSGSGDHRVFAVQSDVAATLRGVEIVDGFADGRTPPHPFYLRGGGIFNEGTLTITECRISGNVAAQGGGGIYSEGGRLTIERSAITSNSTLSDGGAIAGNGELSVVSSEISRNLSQGEGEPPFCQGFCAPTRKGGHALSWGVGDSSVTITDSLIWANEGGGVSSRSGLIMRNSTVSGHDGTGVFASSVGRVAFTTFSDNLSGAISARSLGFVVEHSIVSGGCATDGGWVSGGHNIESPGNTCSFEEPTDQVGVSAEDLRLAPLGERGGQTRSHGLFSGSAAIDQIPLEQCATLPCAPGMLGCDDPEPLAVSFDQRGFPRDSMCDVGAFEVQP